MPEWLNLLLTNAPLLVGLLVLLTLSAALSCSEAAIFFLTPRDCQELESGGQAGKLAVRLLRAPEKLLSTVLFFNLLVNTLFFVISTGLATQLQNQVSPWASAVFGVVMFLLVILLGEMLPKSLGVLRPRFFAALFSVPLTLACRLISPLLPRLQFVNELSRRLVVPTLREEAYLELSDLERAISAGRMDAALLEQEQRILGNLISLSEMPIEESMSPRNQLSLHHAPVRLQAIREAGPDRGFAYLAEPGTEEISAAIPLSTLESLPEDHLERLAEPVLYVPWCTSSGEVFDALQRKSLSVAVVINEYGETIGVVSRQDLLESIFSEFPSRTARVLKQQPLRQVADGVWHTQGITSLRRVARFFHLSVAVKSGQTVAGLFHEQLERLPEEGDQVIWERLSFTVIEIPEPEELLAQVVLLPEAEGDQ